MADDRTLGLDVGGANLKLSDGDGFARSEAFPMWRESATLTERIAALLDRAPTAGRLAVTMTGELADCFASKREGVGFIVDATLAAAGERRTLFYAQSRGLVDAETAKREVLDVAAANWHATATFCGRFAPTGSALFVDAGSTTIDVVPLEEGAPAGVGRTDTERLLAGELVYTGVERTPLAMLARTFRYRNRDCPLAAELFATTADAYVLLGDLPEDATNVDTANGKPRTRVETLRRLARTFCADEAEFDERDAIDLAGQVSRRQANLVAEAVRRVVQRLNAEPTTIVLAGHGAFLARRAFEVAHLARVPVVDLADAIGAEASRAASAFALAVWARENWPR